MDPLLHEFILGVFSIAIGIWGKTLGKRIDIALKNEKLSPKLKSVLVYYFLKTFNLPKESQYMQQFGLLKD